MSYETTGKDFEIFKAECQGWVEYLGLKSWEIGYDFDYDQDCRASCIANKTGRVSTLALSKTFDYKPCGKEIRLMAFHEVLELLFSRYRLAAESRYTTESELEEIRHSIIKTFENTMFVDVNPSKRKKGK